MRVNVGKQVGWPASVLRSHGLESRHSDSQPGSADEPAASEQIARQIATGIDAEVLIHGGYPPQLRGLHCKRYGLTRDFNNWLAEYCCHSPGRLVGVGELPLWDPEAAVLEARRIAALGLRAVLIPMVPGREGPWSPPATAPYSAEVYAPLWAALEDSQLALVTHSDSREAQTPASGTAAAVEMMTRASLPLELVTGLIAAGVFRSHPGLKLVSMDSGIAWLQQTLHWLDRLVDEHPQLFAGMREPPSATFNRHVFATVDWNWVGDYEVIATATSNLMWSEGPNTARAARAAEQLASAQREDVLWRNAVAVFRLPGLS
jgi:predicted TIM-barrel fold metal-dependent hydrolase